MRRDRQIVSFVSRLGAVSIGHIERRFQVGRSVAYDIVKRLIAAGLLERVETLPGDPTLIRATEQGIAYAGLGLPVATIRVGETFHWLACADVALGLERRHGADNLRTEREIRFSERLAGKPIASAKLGELPDARPRLHRPDLAINGREKPIAIEVELTPKAPARLKAIVRAWRRSRWVERVVYLCPPGPTQQGVERAIAAVHAGERVRVVELNPGVADGTAP